MISERAMMWNVDGSNDKRPACKIPRAELDANTERIKDVVKSANVVRATLLDTKGQGSRLDTDKLNGQRIAEKFGFQTGGYVRLEDERLKKAGRGGGEIVFLSQYEKINSQPISLGNRQALSTTIEVGKHGLRVVSLYLDDADEDSRLKETKALLAHLEEEDVPTIIEMDGNSFRTAMDGARLRDRAKDLGVRGLAWALPHIAGWVDDKPGIRHELKWAAKVIPEMNRREVWPMFDEAGFIDGDPRKRPTYQKAGILFAGVDYVLPDKDVAIDMFSPVHGKGISDHLPLTYRATYE